MRFITFRAACIAAILSSPWIACSQHYYVVVGAFAANNNASEVKGFLPDQFMDTSFTVSEKQNLMHFYVLKISDEEKAVSKAMHLKNAIQGWKPGESPATAMRAEGEITGQIKMDTNSEKAEAFPDDPSSASGSSSGGIANAANTPPKPVGKYFKFRIESPEGLPLAAQVHHVDFENGRELAAYNTNTSVDLLRPGTGSKQMAVVCGLFGYKEIYKYIDYSNPSMTDAEAYVDSQGAWVIPYNLERVEKGDVSIMYNVSFYKDAAVMRKSSEIDLEELVKMMHTNPYYEITIHAHCNGRNKRQIIAPGSNRNYFDVDGSVTVQGTAKDLTRLRAETIRGYLSDHGIDPERVNIFSWGASDMLVKADSQDADLNNRVEIEFTRD